MEHTLKLYKKYFDLINNGKKRIEIRLAEPKREKIKIGDTITFLELPEKEKSVTTKVVSKNHFSNIQELLDTYSPSDIGFPNRSKEEVLKSRFLDQIYTDSQIQKYGLITFEIQLEE